MVLLLDIVFFIYCRVCNIFVFGICLNIFKIDDFLLNMKINILKIEIYISKGIIFGVYVFIIIIIGIIGVVFCKE